MYSGTITNRKILFDDLVIQPSTGEVWRGQESICLPNLSFKLLEVLAEAAPATLTQEEIISKVWQDNVVGDETLKQRVKLLRKTLNDKASSPRYIGVVRGRGYRLIPDVKIQVCEQAASPEYIINERVPDFNSIEGLRIWKKMSLALFAVLLVLILLLFGLRQQLNQQTPYYDLQKLAILPFINTTQELQDDYLVKGMTSELIKVISEIDSLVVSPLEKVQTYASSSRLVDQIASKLKVGSILDGALSRRDNRLYFRFKLVDSHEMKVLWEAEYSARPNELLTIQRNVITEVVKHLQAELTPTKRFNELVLTQPSQVAAAYDTYLRGLDYYYRYHVKDNLIAIKLFEQALTNDSQFSDAHAGLADAYSQAVFQFGGNDQWRELALQSAIKAVNLDPQNEVAHKAKALALYLNGQIKSAIDANLTAVKLRPSYVQATTNLGFFYRKNGQLQQALKWNLRTLELDTNYAPGHLHLALTQASMNDLTSAEDSFQKALELKPDYQLAIQEYAVFLATQKRFQQARKLLFQELTDNSYSQLVAAAEVEMLAKEYSKASHFLGKAADYSEVENNQRLSVQLNLCRHLLMQDNQLLQQTKNFEQYLSNNVSDDASDFLLLSMAYAALEEKQQSKQALIKANSVGQVDGHYFQQHPLIRVNGNTKTGSP